MPPTYARKYTDLLLKEIIARKKGIAGTMPAEMRIIREALQAKLADKKFAEAMVNEMIGAKSATVVMK